MSKCHCQNTYINLLRDRLLPDHLLHWHHVPGTYPDSRFNHLTYTSCVQWSSIALERKLIYTRALVDKMETTMTPRTISLNMKLHLLDCDVYISKTVVGTQTAFETLCNPLSGFNILWLENLLRSNVSREITPVTSGQTDPDASVITATNKATTSRCPSTFNNDVSPPVRPIAAWLPR